MSGFSLPPRADLKWALVDLDNTLASPLWTPSNPTHEIGDPIRVNVVKARELHRAGYTVCIHTSRPSHDHEAIEEWCRLNDIPIGHVFTGKPLGVIYCDDRAVNASESSWLPPR